MVTDRERRTILAGLAIAGVAWIVMRGVPWTLQYLRSTRTEIERSSMQLAFAEDLIRRAPLLAQAQRNAQQRRVAMVGRTLHNCDEVVCVDDARAALEETLVDLPVSLEAVEASMDSMLYGDLRRVQVTLRFETDADGLSRVVAALQQQPLRLAFTEIQVEAIDPGALEGAERLRVGIGLSAWAATGRL